MKKTMLTISKNNGKKIQGCLYTPNTKPPFRTVIFAHGYNSKFQDLEHYGPSFCEEGLAICFFDFCGGGLEVLSDGDTREMSVLTELEDYLSVLDYIKELPEVDVTQIYLSGESQGGYVAALAGARRQKDTAGLVLWYPAFNVIDYVKAWDKEEAAEEYVWWGVPLGEIFRKDAMTIDIYEEIRGYFKPVLLIHGDADDIVDMKYSCKAKEVYADAELKVIAGGGHGFEGQQRVEAREATINFIKKR